MTRDRSIALLAAARFVSRTGGEAAFFIGVWGKAAYEMKADPAGIALVMAVLGVASIVGSLVAGVLTDRFGPRKVLIAGEVLLVPSALVTAMTGTIPQLAAAVVFLGISGAIVQTAVVAFAPFMTDDEDRMARINSAVDAAANVAFVLGPAVGALIVRFFGLAPVFWFDAATSVLALPLLAAIRLVRPPGRESGRGFGEGWAEMKLGFRTAYTSRSLRYFMLGATGVWFTFGAFGALEPLFYRDVLHAPIEAVGWANTVFGMGFVVGAWWLARAPRSWVSTTGATIAVALVGVGAGLYVGVPNLAWVIGGAAVWSLVIGFSVPLLRTLVNADSPEGLAGRVSGVMQVHQHGAELIPLALAPWLAATIGVQLAMVIPGLILAVVAVSALGEARAIDRERAALRAVAAGPSGPHEEPISPVP